MLKITSKNTQINQKKGEPEELKGFEESFVVTTALKFMLEGHKMCHKCKHISA